MARTQITPEQDATEPETLSIECDPSLKQGLRTNLSQAGFSSLSDAIRTLARDFIAGRIQYKSGVLISQAQTT